MAAIADDRYDTTSEIDGVQTALSDLDESPLVELKKGPSYRTTEFDSEPLP